MFSSYMEMMHRTGCVSLKEFDIRGIHTFSQYLTYHTFLGFPFNLRALVQLSVSTPASTQTFLSLLSI